MNVYESSVGGNIGVAGMLMGVACRRHCAEKTNHQNGGEAERGFDHTITLQAADGAYHCQSRGKVQPVDCSNGDHRRKQPQLEHEELSVTCRNQMVETSNFVPAVDDA